MLNSQACHFLSACVKTRWWAALVKITRVNDKQLTQETSAKEELQWVGTEMKEKGESKGLVSLRKMIIIHVVFDGIFEN